ncbi:hypothetical protein OQX61_00460 [Pedobacter sp. PLR]|uniref:hypothetical protein n=1 Tax=Pedobacter sp. PLR TaxID=2994465 RepID=UPI002247BF3C|nr:hypothetical protein [Pedobacter sp. PLR]MCX2449725.1 hypothetical protein [Pedobacter sp. PLR]
MTKRNFLKNEILKALSEKLKPYDYKLKKSDDSFIQKTEFGWNMFSTTFLVRSEGWNIRPGLLIRFNVVEDLFHQVSNFEKKYHKGTPTLGTSIENLNINGLEARFDLFEEAQIDRVASELFKLFKSVGTPFFEKYNNLPAVDHQINDDNTVLTGFIFKGTKGLILAKLLGRKDFGILQEKYQHYYESFSDGFYLPEYLRVKELLSSNDR